MAQSVWIQPLLLQTPRAGYASKVYKAQCKHSGVLVCLKSYMLGNLCELNRFQVGLSAVMMP